MSDLIYKLNKTAQDIDDLLLEHKNLVYFLLSKMGQLNNPDAESAAWEALWDAINLFDIYASTAFSTFACTLIKNAINGVLRKQAIEKQYLCAFTYEAENISAVYIEEEDSENFLEQCFREFVASKTGTIQRVLLAWYNSDFMLSGVELAKLCHTSPSYVSRIQRTLRAYLSSKLR